jgi:hypothetical protein
MTPRLAAGLLVSVLGLVLLARVALALLPWGLALAAVVGLGGVGVLLVVVCLGSTED